MADPPMLRLVIQSEGVDREVFGVIERPAGDLIVVFRQGEHEHSFDEYEAINHWKFSVHPGERSPTVRTFKSEKRLGSGRLLENPALIDCSRRDLLAPLVSVRHAWLDHDEVRPRPGDRVHRVAEVDPAEWTLTTHFVVSDRGTLDPRQLVTWLPIQTLAFRLFDLHIATAYSPLPSTSWSDVIELRTITEASGGRTEKAFHPVFAMSPVELRKTLDALHLEIHRRLVVRIDDQLRHLAPGPFNPLAFAELCGRASFFLPDPGFTIDSQKAARAMALLSKLTGDRQRGLRARAYPWGTIILDSPALGLLADHDRGDGGGTEGWSTVDAIA